MLEPGHINYYREEINRAKAQALKEIEKAEIGAKTSLCGGCGYCRNTTKHRLVLAQLTEDLLTLVGTLKDGEGAKCIFPKTMNHESNFYRGFITDTGDYVPIHNRRNHSDYRKEYANEHGEERAYRMINIHGGASKTKVLFCDRKAPPNALQYNILRELMIDARGELSFHFEFDTNHPCFHS